MKRKGIMFKFFTSKLSSIFTPAYQGIMQVVADTVSHATSIVDAATTVIAPVTDALTELPVIGAVIDSTVP